MVKIKKYRNFDILVLSRHRRVEFCNAEITDAIANNYEYYKVIFSSRNNYSINA